MRRNITYQLMSGLAETEIKCKWLSVCGWDPSSQPAHTGNAWEVSVNKFHLTLDVLLPFMLKCHWSKGGVSRTCVFKKSHKHLPVIEQRKMCATAVLPSFRCVPRGFCVVFIVAETNNCETVFFLERNSIRIRLERDTEPRHLFCRGAPSNCELLH